jgi:hypothetical protein
MDAKPFMNAVALLMTFVLAIGIYFILKRNAHECVEHGGRWETTSPVGRTCLPEETK